MLRKKKQTPQEQSDQEFNLALEVPAEQRPKGWRPFVRRNWKRIAAAACAAAVAGANKKAYFGDVNKARLILTLSKTF